LRGRNSVMNRNGSDWGKHFESGLPDFSWSKHTKMGKIYQMTANGHKLPIPNGRKYKWPLKYMNIFHYKALQNLPKLVFLVWKLKTSGNPAANPTVPCICARESLAQRFSIVSKQTAVSDSNSPIL
jgi:hypothetical protein